MLEITDVRVDGFSEFLGVDEKTTLSWKFTGEGEDAFQKSCRIRVKDAQGRISDTGEMETERHHACRFRRWSGGVLRSIRCRLRERIVEEISQRAVG